MTPTLFIRVPENAEAHAQWLYTDSPLADIPVSSGDLGNIVLPDSTFDVVVIVPAAIVGLTEVDIPAQNRGQLLKAVPYALEEELAENVDGLHFAVRPRRNEPTLVAVMERAWLAALLVRLAQNGLKPATVVPETLCLPWREGEWTLLVEDHGAVVRAGRQAGFGLDVDNLLPVFESVKAAESSDGPSALVRIYDRRQQDTAPLPLPAVIRGRPRFRRVVSQLPVPFPGPLDFY